MNRPLQTAALASGLCLAGCAAPQDPPAGEPGAWQGTVERFGSVVTVRNPEAGVWNGIDPTPIRFELDAVFGGPESGIGAIGAALVDASGDVYLYDSGAHRLVGLSGADASVRWRAGAEGDGPGEFRQVRGAAYDGAATIWLVNQNGRRLDAWGTDGVARAAIELADIGLGAVYMGGWLAPDRLALLSEETFDNAANAYVVVDVGGEPTVVDRFRIGTDPPMPIPPGIVLQLSHHFHDGQVFVGTWGRYLLRAYDASGQLRRRVIRPVDVLRRPGFAARGDRFAAIPFGGLGAPIVLPDGHWIVVASWPTNVDDPNGYVETPAAERPPIAWSSSIDVFDPVGRYLVSLETAGSPIPVIGRPWTTDPAGHLYTVSADPFPQLRRYRVLIDPPG